MPADVRANPREEVNLNCVKELVKVFQKRKYVPRRKTMCKGTVMQEAGIS